MTFYVLLDMNAEALGIPGEPQVFTDEAEAQRAWERLVLSALGDIRDAYPEGQRPSYEELLEVPLGEALEFGSTVYIQGDGVELRSWIVEDQS